MYCDYRQFRKVLPVVAFCLVNYMNTHVKRAIALFFAILIIISATINVAAEMIYYYNGYLYTYINNEIVSLCGWDDDSTELIVPDIINTRRVVDISNNAFYENHDLTFLDFSNATYLQRIGSFAFYDCINIDGSITLPNSVNMIDTAAFQNCTSLDSVFFNASTGYIPNQCFNGCSSLSRVTLNDSITEIGYYAFANCPKLSYVEIPVSVKTISDSSFLNDDITLGVYRNSFALEFAMNNEINYVILDPEPTEPPTEPEPTEVPTEAPTEETTVPATEAPTEVSVKYLGDVDGDGTVTSIDATLIQRHLCYIKSMISDEMFMMGDVDGDRIITIIDVTFIMRYLATIEVPFPIGEPIINN